MLIKAIKGFSHDRLGFLQKGVAVEVADAEAERLCRMGHANPAGYQTKVTHDRPIPATGEVQLLSVSPAAQVLPQTTLKESASGKKRGRKKIAASS